MATRERSFLFGRGYVHITGRGAGGIRLPPPPTPPPPGGQGKGGGQGQGQTHGKGQRVGGGRGTGKGQGQGFLAALTAVSATSSIGVVSPNVAGAVTLLSTTTLSGSGTLDVSSISQAFNDLLLEIIVRGTQGAVTDALVIRINNDSGANYDQVFLQGSGASAAVVSSTGNTSAEIAHNIPGNTATANRFGFVDVAIPGYTSTSWHKALDSHYFSSCVTNASDNYVGDISGVWKSTSAVNRVTVFGLATANLAIGSTMRIYGRL